MQTIPAKTILSKNKYANVWFGNDYNMNLYRGCHHGCIYCDSRSECYQNDEFDIVKKKEKALDILSLELMKKRQKGVVGIGAMSDSYNQYEKKEEITRGALQLIRDYRFGVSLETKSDLVVRDIDLFLEIQKYNDVIVKNTIKSMQAGIVFGYIGQTEYIIRTIKEEYGENLKVISTGGLGRIIASETDEIDIYDVDLTFKGLKIIYDKTKKNIYI